MKNIIKRIIVGVAVGLILALVSGCDVVHAATIGSYQFPNAYYEIPNNSDTLNIPINNAFTSYGSGKISFSLAYFSANNEIRSVALSINNGGGLFNCQLNGFNANDSLKNSEYGNYLFYSAICDINVWSNYSINNIQIKFRNPWGTYQANRVYMSNVMSFAGGDNQDVIDAINNANVKTQVQTIIQQLTAINNGFSVKLNDILTALTSNNTKLDQQINEQKETNKQIKETNDFLKDTSAPSSSDMDFSGSNASNGVISDLITMPIRLVQSFLNGFNSSCQPFNLGNLLGTDLVLPCINIGSKLGAVWTIIDTIISGLFIYVFGKSCVKKFNDITNMKENQIDEVFD